MLACSIIAAHLNAPVGAVVLADDVRNALRSGVLTSHSKEADAVLGSMFVEIEPRLIARAALEADVTLVQANNLYLHTVDQGFPRCRQWESSVEVFV